MASLYGAGMVADALSKAVGKYFTEEGEYAERLPDIRKKTFDLQRAYKMAPIEDESARLGLQKQQIESQFLPEKERLAQESQKALIKEREAQAFKTRYPSPKYHYNNKTGEIMIETPQGVKVYRAGQAPPPDPGKDLLNQRRQQEIDKAAREEGAELGMSYLVNAYKSKYGKEPTGETRFDLMRTAGFPEDKIRAERQFYEQQTQNDIREKNAERRHQELLDKEKKSSDKATASRFKDVRNYVTKEVDKLLKDPSGFGSLNIGSNVQERDAVRRYLIDKGMREMFGAETQLLDMLGEEVPIPEHAREILTGEKTGKSGFDFKGLDTIKNFFSKLLSRGEKKNVPAPKEYQTSSREIAKIVQELAAGKTLKKSEIISRLTSAGVDANRAEMIFNELYRTSK